MKTSSAVILRNYQGARPIPTTVRAAVASLLLAAAHSPVWAGPQGGQVTAGAATIDSTAPGVTAIKQSTDRLVIDWRTFSIAQDEQVQFFQPDSSSVALNRVLGGQRSIIDGALTANGNVFLLNPSGILFGRTARVDVGGLLATTSRLSNDDFLAGRLHFAPGGQAGSVENEGLLSIRDGGFAALVAPTVRNSGRINAHVGKVVLAGTETYTVDLYGDHLINFALPNGQQPVAGSTAGLVQDGGQVGISATGVSAVLAAVSNLDAYDPAIGAVQAENGDVVLLSGRVSQEGVIDVSGPVGGTVDLIGGEVRLASGSLIDASGDFGGGTVRVGGDAAGAGGPRASSVTVEAGARIAADATQSGDGGRVTLWGQQLADFNGAISVRGGPAGGNGGFVEVSSADVVRFLGDVFLDAPRGKGGLLFLDPEDVVILPIGSSSTEASVINSQALNAILRSGGNVIIAATNSIRVQDLIDGRGGAAGGEVQLTAGSIVLTKPVITNDGAITLNATSGSVTFDADAFLWVSNGTTGAGTADISIAAAQDVTATAATSETGRFISLGALRVTATSGNVSFLHALDGIADSRLGSITVRAGSDVTLSGAVSTGTIDIRSTGTGGSISNQGAGISGQSVWLESGTGGLHLGGATAPQSTGVTATNGDVVLLTTGDTAIDSNILASGNVCIGAGAGDVCGGTSAASDIRTGAVTAAEGTAIQANGAAGVSIYSNGAVDLQDVLATSSGTVHVVSNGAVTLNRAINGLATSATGVGSLVVEAGGAVSAAGAHAGTVQLSGSSIDTGGVPITAHGNVSISSTGPGGISIGADPNSIAIRTTGTGTVALLSQSGGAVNIHGDIQTAGGGITVNSSSGITADDGAALQTYQPNGNGSISLTAAGSISVDDLVAGPAGAVTITTTGPQGNVELRKDIAGWSGSSGVGSLSIAASGTSVAMQGAKTAGNIQIATGGDVTVGGAGLSAGGNVTIGSTGARVRSVVVPAIEAANVSIAARESSSGAPLGQVRRFLPSGQLTEGAVWLGGVNVARGGAVSLRGADITVLGDIGQFQAGAPASRTAGAVDIFGSRSVDLRAVSGGIGGQQVRLLTSSTGTIALRGQVMSFGPVTVGLDVPTTGTAPRPHINLSNNIFTAGQTITFNGDVVLFDGIDRFMIELALRCANGPQGVGSLCTPIQWSHLSGVPYFDVNLFRTIATNSSPDDFYDALTLGRGFPYEGTADGFGTFGYNALFGTLTATLSTVVNSGGAQEVTVNGSLARYVSSLPAQDPTFSNTYSGIFQSDGPNGPTQLAVDASFVNHVLDVSGIAGLHVTGTIGDLAAETRRVLALNGSGLSSVRDNSPDGPPYVPLVAQTPTLGRFSIVGSGSTPITADTAGGTVYVVSDDDFEDYGSNFNSNVGIVRFVYQTDSNDPGANTVRPGGAGSLGDRSLPSLVLTGGGTSGTTAPAGGGIVGQPPGSSSDPTVSSGTQSDIASTSSAEDRRQEEQSPSDSGEEEDNQDNSCPRGAGATADMGTQRGAEGAAPDVFAQCRELRIASADSR